MEFGFHILRFENVKEKEEEEEKRKGQKELYPVESLRNLRRRVCGRQLRKVKIEI